MLSKQLTFIQWCLHQAGQAPIRDRIMVYRQLAKVTGDESEAKDLAKLADELEAADKRCAQFAFELGQKGA